MSRNDETGYAIGVADFKIVVSVAQSYGDAYNPAIETIKLPNLQKMASDATMALETLNSQLSLQKEAIQKRNAAFTPLRKFITRLMAYSKALGISEQQVEGLKNQNRKLQGARASAIKEGEVKQDGTPLVHISSSQQGYDNVVDNFDRFVKLLQTIPEYQPNETELQVAQLQTLYTDLKEKNNAVIKANTDIFNSRVARNTILFKEKEGLHDVALAVKNYLKAVYGSADPKYKVISKIKFRKH